MVMEIVDPDESRQAAWAYHFQPIFKNLDTDMIPTDAVRAVSSIDDGFKPGKLRNNGGPCKSSVRPQPQSTWQASPYQATRSVYLLRN